jgi:hypothetical protein
MSISDMADRAAAMDTRTVGAPAKAEPNLGSALAAISAYFPAETLATYLAAMAIIQPGGRAGQWAFFGLFLAFTWVVVLYYAWLRQKRKGEPGIDTRRVAWLFAFSGVAFTVWSATTPWTPFLAFSDDAQIYAGFTAIVLSPLLPMAAEVLGISPPWRGQKPA